MKSLWVTNFNKKAISIPDLGISLQPRQSMDLLRLKMITKEQIKNSYLTGDLRKTKLHISDNKLEMIAPKLTEFKKVFPSKSVSAIKIEYKKFAELEELMSSESFDNLSDSDKATMENQILAKKEEEMISRMLEE